MIKKMISIFMAILFIAAGAGQAATRGGIPDHPHLFPYTKVLGEKYHIRLIVDHTEGEMILLFEDISEFAVEIMPLKTIAGELILPGGERRAIEFKAVKDDTAWTHGDPHPVLRLSKRKAGKFLYRADEVKELRDFDLIVSFPFKDKDYKFVFEYSAGDMYPGHRRK
jgi:hypothetical protein